jgi:hypothetical protein
VFPLTGQINIRLEKETAAERKSKGRENSKGEKERREESKTCIMRKGTGE